MAMCHMCLSIRHGCLLLGNLKSQVLRKNPVLSQSRCFSNHRTSILSAKSTNNGKQVHIVFGDGSAYNFHSAWIRDASAQNIGPDFYRTSAEAVLSLKENAVISHVSVDPSGTDIVVTYGPGQTPDKIPSAFIYAFAPHVGQELTGKTGVASDTQINGTGSLLDAVVPKVTWTSSELDLPIYHADALGSDIEVQVKFLESLNEIGVAMVKGMGPAPSMAHADVGLPLAQLVENAVGKLNQHPVREQNWGVIRKSAAAALQGADYDVCNPLSMHTDHSHYAGTPGFLQFMYQAQGSVTSTVADGFAVAEHLQRHDPDAFALLCRVQVTHGLRNVLYTRQGTPRNIHDSTLDAAAFEVIHTHPTIVLDETTGAVAQVIQSETKRGVCAIPHDVYEPFMAAYQKWANLCERSQFKRDIHWPEHTAIVTNNHRVMHGRAKVPAEMERTMVFGYVEKRRVDNRYRYLRQELFERAHPEIGTEWLTRIPNQVLERMVGIEEEEVSSECREG